MEYSLSKYKNALILLGFCIFTAVLYSGMLNYPVLIKDDVDYFTLYPEVRDLSLTSIGKYFTSYYVLMYQPLPVLTFAINYHLTGTGAFPLHSVNLFFHLVNIVLVFLFFKKLFNKDIPALLISFFFAIHPMNVEAVTWISSRSSSMYTCFYLLSLVIYLNYIRGKPRIHLILLSFFFFLVSLLCKVQAITFPLVLFLLDYYSGRKKTTLLFLEKVPFLLLSIIFTVIAFRNPETTVYFIHAHVKEYSNPDQLFLNGRTFFFYLRNFILPVNLSALYAFPAKSNSFLPLGYYLDSLLVIILFIMILRLRKNKELILGAGLFLFTLVINLPLNSVRNVIYTDRYAYFPYLGLLVIFAAFYQAFFEKYHETHKNFVYGVTALIIAYGLFLSYETKTRNKVWSSDLVLTTDIINKNPPVPSMAKIYRIRGEYYAHHQETGKSISDFTKAIELDSMDINIYIYRAYAYIKENRLKDALPDLNKAIFYKPGTSVLYANRAMVKLNTGDRMGAWQDCNKCLSLDPANAEAYNFLAIIKFGSNDLQGAEKDLRNAIRYNDQYAEAYKNLGIVLFQLKRTDQACYYWDIAARFGDRQSIQFLKINCLHK